MYHLDPVSVSLLLSEAPAHTVTLTVSDTLKLAVSDTSPLVSKKMCQSRQHYQEQQFHSASGQ